MINQAKERIEKIILKNDLLFGINRSIDKDYLKVFCQVYVIDLSEAILEEVGRCCRVLMN